MKQLSPKETKKFFKTVPKREKNIALVLENIQYAKNVAGMFRIADGAGVNKLFLTGNTRKPPFGKDLRKASRNKEKSVNWEYKEGILVLLDDLKQQGYTIIAIEVTDNAIPLLELSGTIKGTDKVAFVAGSETSGIRKFTLQKCDTSVYIPMYGKGRSLNVTMSVAAVLFSF